MDEQSNKQDEPTNAQNPAAGETFSPDSGADTPKTDTPMMTAPESAPTKAPTTPTPQVTEPVPAAPVSSSAAPMSPVQDLMPTPKSSRLPLMIAAGVIGLAVLVGAVLGAYRLGNDHGYTNGKNKEAATIASTQLKVPSDATMTSQCMEGEGTQYVKPSNIPMGPIYNVWKGKITGIEYMLGQSEIANSKTLDLALQNQKYDHVDVMYEPSGHAGFTEPHYHVVLSMIPYSEEQMITCGNSSSSKSMM